MPHGKLEVIKIDGKKVKCMCNTSPVQWLLLFLDDFQLLLYFFPHCAWIVSSKGMDYTFAEWRDFNSPNPFFNAWVQDWVIMSAPCSLSLKIFTPLEYYSVTFCLHTHLLLFLGTPKDRLLCLLILYFSSINLFVLGHTSLLITSFLH